MCNLIYGQADNTILIYVNHYPINTLNPIHVLLKVNDKEPLLFCIAGKTWEGLVHIYIENQLTNISQLHVLFDEQLTIEIQSTNLNTNSILLHNNIHF